jgi:hypothetical protein
VQEGEPNRQKRDFGAVAGGIAIGVVASAAYDLIKEGGSSFVQGIRENANTTRPFHPGRPSYG